MHGSVEPEANKLVVGTMGQEIGEASVSLFMGLVVLSLQRIIKLLSEWSSPMIKRLALTLWVSLKAGK